MCARGESPKPDCAKCVQGRSASKNFSRSLAKQILELRRINEAAVAEIQKKDSNSLTERHSERGQRKDSLSFSRKLSEQSAALSSVPALLRSEPLASYHRNGTGVGAQTRITPIVSRRSSGKSERSTRNRTRTRGSVID